MEIKNIVFTALNNNINNYFLIDIFQGRYADHISTILLDICNSTFSM
jgi:hypothetical protein